MTSFIPITLSGNNLGERHRHLNSLVNKAVESGVSFQDIECLPEQSPVDRLFKIDVAAKLKNIDYIIRNLKDEDMLFVSRALKSSWLLHYQDIINPKYLEDILFPEMVSPAVTKMRHYIALNLRDPAVCQEFYRHYKTKTFEFSIKFLCHCTSDFILEEVPKILTKISTHYLKLLCEKCPKVAKIYFNSLATDEEVKSCYLKQEQSYYNSVKCVLKSDADLFLEITEKYFNLNTFTRFSPLATDYILRCHKSRFASKLELYVAYFLHIPTLAARLTVEECQEVVIKLARANYLQHWFQYKVVEPLIKRLSPYKRAAFKKRVFVEKDIGECVGVWPYATPKSPAPNDSDPHIFYDVNYLPICEMVDFKCMLKKRKFASWKCIPNKSDLDRLFEEFRFIGFERALHDLGKRLAAAGSTERRRDILLVLVSKSGGRCESVSALLRLATRHQNEPPQTRASILRSLVKRANPWRLPPDVWQLFLDFGHGLGFDGASPEAACREGLHAVVIRQLLLGECEKAVCAAFLKEFSSLAEYSLSTDERARISYGLQNMLTAAAVDVEPVVAVERLSQLLDVIETYHVHVKAQSPLPIIELVKSLALREAEVTRPLLERLYNAKIGRRELLRVNLRFRCDQEAFLNALRHDPSALEHELVANMVVHGETRFDGFIWKLVVYFNQKEDFAVNLRTALNEQIVNNQITNDKKAKLARTLASLWSDDFENELRKLDATGEDRVKFAAAVRATAHIARPRINLMQWGWRRAGVKSIATQAMRSRKEERVGLISSLASERRTVRVALALSMRSEEKLLLETFASAVKLRPVIALHAALRYFRHLGDNADPEVWSIIKPLLSTMNLSSRERLCRLLVKTEWIPSTIKPDYCGTLFIVIDKISNPISEHLLRDLCMLLPEVSIDIIENVLFYLLKKTEGNDPLSLPAIFVRYLMLSRNHEDLERRFAHFGVPFFERLDGLRCTGDAIFQKRLHQIMDSLKYNAAFIDTKYESCLLVIERVLAWIQKFMPKEVYFNKYVQIHLTMLYFKAVRQTMKQVPEVFAELKNRKVECAEAVGFVFGRYIAKEVAELVSTFFDSMVELYTSALVDYLRENYMYGTTGAKFIGLVIKGLWEEGVGVGRRLAVNVFKECRNDIEEFTRKEIRASMERDRTIDLIVFAELLG